MKFLYINFVIVLCLTAITTFALGIFVLIRNRHNIVNKTFAFYSFSISWWGFSEIWGIACDKRLTALIWTRIEQVGVFFIPTFFIHFVISLLNIKDKKWLLRVAYSFSIIFAILCSTPLMIADSVPKRTVPYVKHFGTSGSAYYFAILFFVILSIYGLSKLYNAYRLSYGARKNQLKYLFWSSLSGYVGGAANFLLVYGINVPILNPFGTYALPIYIAIVAYAISRYRLMDVNVALTRTGIFVAVYTLILGFPFVIAVRAKGWLIDKFGASWWMLPLGLMGVLATVGPFIYIYLQRRAEDRLLREQRRYQESLKQASIGMTRIRNLRKLLDLITHIVTKTVRISYAAIYLYSEEADEYVLQISRDKDRTPISKLSSDNPLLAWLTLKREPLIYEEVKRQMEDTNDAAYRQLEENMRFLTASVIIPSFLEDRFMGFFVLGDKISGQIYTVDDLNVFQVLASQAALAIENAQFYEEAKEMQEQIAQAEKMATIGTMADGLSHQINNRFYALSLITGDTIDTIKTTDTSKCTPEVKEMIEQINHALQRIQSNVTQGGEVVRGLLKYSRKGDAGFEALDLNSLLDNTLEMVQYKVKLSEINIIRDFPKNIPKIKGNMAQLEEAFFNFVDNAYDAIVERRRLLKEKGYRGKITISARPKNNNLEIIVEDNGMGIKFANHEKIFTPFFTTKATSRKGTGLGLYVIRRIITDMHKGKIAFESEYKAGTRFILELPIAQ